MPIIPASCEAEVGESKSKASLGKSTRLYLKKNKKNKKQQQQKQKELKVKGLRVWFKW
jgi:hypothetical protein